MSALARLISALSSRLDEERPVADELGRSRPDRRRRARPGTPRARDPRPYQPGRLIRACDQAKVHGIARRASIGSGAQPRDRPRAAGRDPRREVGQFPNRGDVPEERGEARVIVDERAVGGPRGRAQLGQDRRPGVERPAQLSLVIRCRREQDGADRLLEVAVRDREVRVVRRDDLALLGHLEPTVHRTGSEAQDRPVASALRLGRWPHPGRGTRSAPRPASGRPRRVRPWACWSIHARGEEARAPCSNRSSRA